MFRYYDPLVNKPDWEKHGECNHCASCCDPYCPAIQWIALREIKAGEIIKPGVQHGQLRSKCLAWGTDENVNGCTRQPRENAPSSPHSTLVQCGFYWVQKAGVKPDGD